MVVHAVRSEATIGRILAAAESLFLSRSYADVTMEDIAAKAEATKGAVYHHFESKEELYAEMMTADLERKRSLFSTAGEIPGGLRARLRALTAAHFALPREKRDLIHLVRRDTNVFRGPLRSRLVRAYQEALPQAVERIISDAMKAGEIRKADARLLSWHFVAMVEVTMHRYADALFPDTNDRIDHVIDLFLKGVTA